MGWWKEDDHIGTIGDGPIDACVMAIMEFASESGVQLEIRQILAAFEQALKRNPDGLVSDPASVQRKKLLARWTQGTKVPTNSLGEPVSTQWIDRASLAIHEVGSNYRLAFDGRLPTTSELVGTLTYAITGFEDDQVAAANSLNSVILVKQP